MLWFQVITSRIPPEFVDVSLQRLTFVMTKLITEMKDNKGHPYVAGTFYSLIQGLNRVSVLPKDVNI